MTEEEVEAMTDLRRGRDQRRVLRRWLEDRGYQYEVNFFPIERQPKWYSVMHPQARTDPKRERPRVRAA